jgi:RNA polymerase sigma-70 factor (ECF subfamily)
MDRIEGLSDEQLLPLIAAGNAAALEAIYERRQSGIYRFALRMCGCRSAAEDVTHDVFIALMRDAGHYDSARGSVSAYLYGMARNRVLRLLQRDRGFASIGEDASEGESSVEEALILREDPLAVLTRSELIDSVRGAILALPLHYREAVVLCNLQEMSYAEAADVLGCPIGTVRSRLYRARELLIKKLREDSSSEVGKNATNTVCLGTQSL